MLSALPLCRCQQSRDSLPFTASWTEGKCTVCKSAEYLNGVQFTTRTEAWGIGNDVPPQGALNYILLHTSDGGRTWREYPRTLQHAAPPSVYFLDPANGWMAYWDRWAGITQTKLARTSDGGKNWRVISRGSIDSAVFTDRKQGIGIRLGMFPNAAWLHTADGGRTWTELRIPHLRPDARRYINAGSTIWIVQGEGPSVTFFRTTDGGQSWEEFDATLPKEWAKSQAIQFLDRNRGWMIASGESGNAGRLLTTVDGGRTWTLSPSVSLSENGGGTSVVFVSERIGFLFEETRGPARSTEVWFTQDGGAQWLKHPLPYSISTCQAFASDVLCAAASASSNFGVLTLHPPQYD